MEADVKRDVIQRFADRFGLDAGMITIDGDTFFAATKKGADPHHHGWILAEFDGIGILYMPSDTMFAYDPWLKASDLSEDASYVKGWHDRVDDRKKEQIAKQGFAPQDACPFNDEIRVSIAALERMIATGIDPYGESIADAIDSWGP